MKNLISLFSVLAASLALMASASANEGDELHLSLDIEERDYAWNESLDVTVSLHSAASEDIWITFPDACYFTLRIENEAGVTVATEDSFCAQVLTEVKIIPGQTWELNESIDLDAMAGLEAGTYTVVVESEATAKTENSNDDVTVPSGEMDFSMNLPLTISYELNKEEYRNDDTLEIEYEIRNEGSESFEFSTDCGPYIILYDSISLESLFDEEQMSQGECEETENTVSVGAKESLSGTASMHLGEVDPGVYKAQLEFNTNVYTEVFMLVSEDFVDIYGHWAEDYIQELYLEGVVEGYDRYYFKPDQSVTRAEFLKIMFETMHLDLTVGADVHSSAFVDVDEDDWFYVYTESAYEQEIVSGYSNQTFAPNQEITRAEAVSIMLASIGIDANEVPDRDSVFTDVRTEWQVRIIMEAYERGIVRGYRDENGQPLWLFGPNNPLTRAEACKLAVETRAEVN